jgi:hypothetical protein
MISIGYNISELVGSQYYWIYHWHPVCLLGYISAFEEQPPRKNAINQLQKMTGYPETSFRTLAEHSDLDLRHRDDLNEMLESLPLRSEHEKWITSNAIYSAYRLIEIGNKLRLYE